MRKCLIDNVKMCVCVKVMPGDIVKENVSLANAGSTDAGPRGAWVVIRAKCLETRFMIGVIHLVMFASGRDGEGNFTSYRVY